MNSAGEGCRALNVSARPAPLAMRRWILGWGGVWGGEEGLEGESYGLGDGFMCIKESTVEVEDCEGYHCEVCIQRFEAG